MTCSVAVNWDDHHLPCPSILAFDYEIDLGLIRSDFDVGHARQKRRYLHRPTYYQVSWSGLTTGQLQAWEAFMQEYGFNWFCASFITGQTGDWVIDEHTIRFVENPQISLQRKDRWSVTITAEQQVVA